MHLSLLLGGSMLAGWRCWKYYLDTDLPSLLGDNPTLARLHDLSLAGTGLFGVLTLVALIAWAGRAWHLWEHTLTTTTDRNRA